MRIDKEGGEAVRAEENVALLVQRSKADEGRKWDMGALGTEGLRWTQRSQRFIADQCGMVRSHNS